MRRVEYQDLGLKDYQQAWDYQERLFNAVIAQKIENRKLPESAQVATKNYLLFCEHPHVYTLGKSGSEDNLLASEALLTQRGAKFYKINRGGDITYHGPGQIVGYPIFDLDHFFTDIHLYLRCLEEAVILTLEEYGIAGDRLEGMTGVWLEPGTPNERKICALGVKCSRWVTMHGFAFNVNTDLSYFEHIVPCGITGKAVTSLKKELGFEVNMDEARQRLKVNLANVFDFDITKTVT